jgi:hypothetical protein
MKFIPEIKPPSLVCPQKYCFCWIEKGVHIIGPPGEGKIADESRCGSPFGKCIRCYPQESIKDYYEPEESELEEAGLPWFYFYANPASVAEEFRSDYITKSESLWGKEHWVNAHEI